MNYKYMIMLMLSILFSLSACDLNEDTSGFSQPGTFYRTKAECQSAVNACYIPLKTIFNYAYMIATEGVTDICYIPSGTQDAQLDITPAKPRYGATVWTQGYKGVMYCNSTIAGVQKSELEGKIKNPIIAEAKILRALYYYILTSFFGDVPFYTKDVSDQTVLMEVAKLPRMSAVDTRDALIKDIESCIQDLDKVRTSESPQQRIGAAVGYMIMAKMAMWNKEYEKALVYLGELEGIYGDFSQYPLSDIPFRNKNTPESIFEIQHTFTPGGLNYTTNIGCICMPYPRSIDSETKVSTYCGVEIEELGSEATTWVPMRPNDYFYLSLQSETSGDLRRDMNIVSEWNEHKFNKTRPFFGPKFWCPNQQGQYDSNNHKVFRYADALLMISECYCALKQEPDKAVKYLNMIKSRAGLPEYIFANWNKLFLEIKAERARELIGEFQRKYDLVRWGEWYDRTYEYSDYEKVKNNILPCHEYYPIPDTEVVYSGYALDNKAYNACGL